MDTSNFHIVDYVVLGVFLFLSLAIGVYYGVIRRQQTTEAYLMGNRKMQLVPVSLSLLVTYQSAISVMGVTAEVYVYDTMFYYLYGAIIITSVIQAYMIVPLVHPLHLTSAYEYLGGRFNSRSVQLLGTLISMLQTLLYMSVVLFAPALALEAVAGIPLWMSIIVVGIIGTFYTSVGGIKSVIWTDVFQCIILFGGLIAIMILSSIRLGGMGRVLHLASEGGRINLSSASLDPRVRHTIWSCLIGGSFQWLPNCCNQSAIQRICSMRRLRDAKMAVLLTIPMLALYSSVLIFSGCILYAYYEVQQCDPIGAGYITNSNQLMPYYVMNVLRNMPGLAGLFIASLFSGALSTLSSGINSMSANTVQDILPKVLEKRSQGQQTFVAKLIVMGFGGLTVVLAYLTQYLPGTVTQLGLTAMGACGGPVTGIMLLGAAFPQANWIGAFSGGLAGIIFNVWLTICSFLYGAKAPKSPSITTDGCYGNATNVTMATSAWSYLNDTVTPSFVPMNITEELLTSSAANHHIPLYDISYFYFGLTGMLVSVILGLIISLCTGRDRNSPTDFKYILPCLRNVWSAGYKSVVTYPEPPEMTLTVQQSGGKKSRDLSDSKVSGTSPGQQPIKALDFSWLDKCPDDEL